MLIGASFPDFAQSIRVRFGFGNSIIRAFGVSQFVDLVSSSGDHILES